MAEGLLSIERRDGVALVTLERPEKRNALSIELRLELQSTFEGLSADESVGCVVLTGAGPAFCAGIDLTQFGGDLEHKRRLVESSTGAFTAVGTCSRPVIAAVNGPALAGGFALALLCDLRLASEEATFGFPELPRGIPPAYAAARAVLAPSVAAELALTGRILGAEDALALGVASEMLPQEAVLPRALDLAEGIAAAPRWAILETKRRMLFERDLAWGPLFAEEERVFRQSLLRDEEPDPAA
jgi:enoyl-CoA hydratase/carnithine racemase